MERSKFDMEKMRKKEKVGKENKKRYGRERNERRD